MRLESVTLLRACVLCPVLALTACASGTSRDGIADKALDWVGLQTKRPPAESLATPVPKPQRVTVRIHAGDLLNSDANGRSLSLVAKVYALKDPDAFLRAPRDAFDGATPGPGITELREVVLTPGRQVDVVETVGDGVRHLGIVGLFRTPDEKRWRYAFDVATLPATGITIGAHGCALSVAEGEPLRTPADAQRLSGVRCP